MKLTIFMRWPHREQTSGSTCHTCLIKAAIGLVGRGVVVINLDGGAVLAVGLGAMAAGPPGIETEITNQLLVGIGDVPGELGDEVQRAKDLEGAGHVAQEAGAGGLGEGPAVPLLGAVDHLVPIRDADEALKAEGTSQHVLGIA